MGLKPSGKKSTIDVDNSHLLFKGTQYENSDFALIKFYTALHIYFVPSEYLSWRHFFEREFIMEENQRVLDLVQVLPKGRPVPLHALFAASYNGARDLYEIGAPAMDAMMHAMSTAPGVIAARQAGAGFGGSMVALVKGGSLDRFTEYVTNSYQQETKIHPEVYVVQAAPGAMILD